nr:collagen alpha-1(XII) chain-like [Vicugna pacos]
MGLAAAAELPVLHGDSGRGPRGGLRAGPRRGPRSSNLRSGRGLPRRAVTRIGGQQNSVVLQKLKPDTPYTITLSSLCCDVEGGRMTGRGETKPLNTMRNLGVRAFHQHFVRWEHTEQNPHQYKLFCAPTAGGLEELVTISL